MEEEEKIIVSDNNDDKGNPFHKPAGSPDGGQFTSGPESAGADNSVTPKPKISLAEIKARIAAKKNDQAKQEALERLRAKNERSIEAQSFADQLNQLVLEQTNLDNEEKWSTLANMQVMGFDFRKMNAASEGEINALYAAVSLTNEKQTLNYKIASASTEKQKLLEKVQAIESDEAFEEKMKKLGSKVKFPELKGALYKSHGAQPNLYDYEEYSKPRYEHVFLKDENGQYLKDENGNYKWEIVEKSYLEDKIEIYQKLVKDNQETKKKFEDLTLEEAIEEEHGDPYWTKDWYLPSKSGTTIEEKFELYKQKYIQDRQEDIDDYQKKLDALYTFKLKGEEFQKLKEAEKEKWNATKAPELNAAKAQLDEATANLKKLSSRRETLVSNPLLKEAYDYIGRFQDQEAPYSVYRKNNATWIQGSNVVQQSIQHFGTYFDKNILPNLNGEEKGVLYEYTGSGFSKFNKPLRGIMHLSHGYKFNNNKTFSQAVELMDTALEKCMWDEDIWVQRRVDAQDTPIFQKKLSDGSTHLENVSNMSDEDLKALIGTSFREKGFYSAGAAKGTGYGDSSLILNTYCPKGTKMAYMNTIGAYNNSHENEMIISRGYSFRITKVEKLPHGQYYIDCEIILGSDSDKPVGNELKKIGNEYYASQVGAGYESIDDDDIEDL